MLTGCVCEAVGGGADQTGIPAGCSHQNLRPYRTYETKQDTPTTRSSHNPEGFTFCRSCCSLRKYHFIFCPRSIYVPGIYTCFGSTTSNTHSLTAVATSTQMSFRLGNTVVALTILTQENDQGLYTTRVTTYYKHTIILNRNTTYSTPAAAILCRQDSFSLQKHYPTRRERGKLHLPPKRLTNSTIYGHLLSLSLC